jgi:cell division transport system permease protein
MKINSLKYCVRQSYVSISRNFWLAVVTAGIIAVSLAALGGFLLVAVNAGNLIQNFESNVEINVFLDKDADADTVRLSLDKLEGVKSYSFVTKEQGLEEFGRAMGDRIPLGGLEGENNPLPDMFRVRVQEAGLVPVLAQEIQTFPGVELADYGEEIVTRLLAATRWLNMLFLVISLLLATGAVFLIVTIIRLSVMARQEEVGVMKYLGASNSFIRFPFFMEGMAMGLLGALAAAVPLGVLYHRLAILLERDALIFFLQPVTDQARLWPIFAGLLVMGTLMGGLGSLVAVRKFLRG